MNAAIENNFKQHPPQPGRTEKYVAILEQAKIFAYTIEDLCPPGREKALAMTNLENAVFWANAGIARSQPPP